MGNGYTEELAMSNDMDILDVIFNLESSAGTNKRAYKSNKYGALGGYQIRPDAYKDVQRVFKSKWEGKDFNSVGMSNELSREAASDYLKVISMFYKNNKIPITEDNLLLGYHSGMGNVAKGNIGKDGVGYIAKAHKLRGGK